ncbi:MAG TPA: ATP-binding protein [Verrucomicrobiae bacterium]|jgi:signal transduction histidine kinase
MRPPLLERHVLAAAFVFVALAQAHGQQAPSWREFNQSQGFPQSSFSSVTLAENGAVLAVDSALSSVCLFDGFDAKSLPLPPGAARVYQSPAGQLWTLSPRGLWTFREQDWKCYPLDGLAGAASVSKIPLSPVRLNVALCLLPGELIECNAEDPAHFRVQTLREAGANLGQFSSMAVGVEDELWIVGERGLARVSGPQRSLSAASEWREFVVPASLHLLRLRHPQPDENGVTLAADSSQDGQSRMVHFDGDQWQARTLGAAQVSFAWRGPDNSYWACSSNRLFHESPSGLAVDAALSPRRYNDVAVDWHGTFWLATSAGLVRYAPNLWQPAAADDSTSALAQSLAGSGYWPETFGQIAAFDMDSTNGAGMRSGQSGARFKPIGLLRDGHVCYATAPSKDSNRRNGLGAFDGTNFQALPIFVPQAAAAANLHCLLAAPSGDLWLGGDFGTAWLHGRWTVFPATNSGSPEGTLHLAELPGGQVWSASREKIWSFDGRDWSLERGGFDHLSAMICARDGSVWVGDNKGITRFVKGHWIENGAEEGLDGGPCRALCEDQRGTIRAVQSRGVALYHPEADTEPPRTFITPMTEKERNIPEDGVIAVQFGGRDKWNGTPAGRLLFSSRLDTGEWSPFAGADKVSFSDLPAGRHYFQVRAMDRAGNIDPDPAQMDFAMMLPWYKESRLVLIASAGAIAAGFFAILAWRRHRALLLSYAQVGQQVAQRTRELELAHQELLQSQKMRALGTLAAGIAHDFNNILSIVKGSAQIIEDNLENPAKIRTRADRIKTVVDQGSAVVQAMLGFSRGSDEVLEICQVNPVLDNTLKLLGDRFSREVELCFTRAPALPGVRASPSLVQQILLNFIFNAAESMNGRKRVIIATALAGALPARMALAPGAAADYVTVTVRDFGCGIAPEMVGRVFEPFFTTKALSSRRGTGLGLSIVYELAKKMDAGLAVESTVGEGSVFSLFLPAVPKEESVAKSQP